MRTPLVSALGLVLVLGVAAPLHGDAGPVDLSVDSAQSSVSYQIVHKLHKVQGTSRRAEGKGRLLPGGRAQVMVRVPVESFDSGNANRDAHMKEAVEAARYAVVELKAAGEGIEVPATFPATLEKTFQGEVSFHGIKKPVEVPVRLTFEAEGRVRVASRFSISLDGFKVERPSLLFVKVDDAAQIDASLLFRR